MRNKNTLPLEIYSVNNIVGFVPQSEQFDDAGYLRNTDTSIYMIVPPKHFAYNPARIDIGSIGYQYLDHDVQVSSLYEVFKTSDSVDDDFLWIWFHTSYFNHTVKRLQEGGVRLYFYYDKMQETKIGLPSLVEQQKIASLFTELDALIQSAEKELEGYRELKQGMLQKMFPKKGEKVPEIRFPEFTDDWEQCKLGDVTEFIRNGLNYKSDGDRNYRYKITRIESISTGKINIEKLGSSETINKSYKLREGDILFSHINSLPYIGNTAIYNAKFGEIYHGMNLLNIRVNQAIVFPYFLIHLLKRETSRRYFKIVAKQAVNQASISITDVEMFGFLIPTLEEQKKIGEYFSNLDNLIALQQKELDGYKELKKGLLQQMFC